jgi:arylsulfatase A-like enzyme
VVITSDHGEMLGDHRGLVGHMLSLHDSVLHIPLVVRHPDYPAGLTVEGVVQLLDLYPSVIEWAGVSSGRMPAAQLQRPSLSAAVSSPACPSGYAFAEEDYTDSYNVPEGLVGNNPLMDPHRYPCQQIAVHSATHKYIWCDDRPAELYDLEADPLETCDLASQGRATIEAAKLQGVLEQWLSELQEFPPQMVEEPGEVSPETIDRLRALGYVA